MSKLSKIAIIKELLDSANEKINNARKMLSDITGDYQAVSDDIFVNKAKSIDVDMS